MKIRICLAALLLACACAPLAAQRRADAWAVPGASADARWMSADAEMHPYLLQTETRIGEREARPRLAPAIGMVVGGVAGAALGMGLSRATCDPERCEELTHVVALFGGGLAGAALGYIIAGGKRLQGTRPPAYPRRAPR